MRLVIALSAVVGVWSFAAGAQRQILPTVAILYAGSAAGMSPTYVAAFREGIREAGFIEGQDVTLDFRFAENIPTHSLKSQLIWSATT